MEYNGLLKLRAAAITAIPVGAAGSMALMLYVGRRNNSPILLILFTVWVLSPFLALAWANLVSKSKGTATYGVTLVLTLASLAIYSVVAFGPPRAKPAFFFLVVPLASWILLAVVTIAARSSLTKH